MRHSLFLPWFLAILAGCGAEPPEPARPDSGIEREPEAPGPALTGRAEATAAVRRMRRLSTLADLRANARVRVALSDADLAILEQPDVVRLIAGDPLLAMSETEIAAGFEPTDFVPSPSVAITRAADRGELVFRLLRSIAGSDGSRARCFQPEQTIRFCRGGRCVEVEVCLGCRLVCVAASDEAEVRFASIDGSMRSALLGMCSRYGLDARGGCGS